MNEFGDLLGTPYAPVSKIAPVNGKQKQMKPLLVSSVLALGATQTLI